ncbi:MAG: mercury methylation ferredoxin HgcB [Bacteroidota bacterium]
MNGLIYIKDVVTLKLDVDKCIGCELCVIVCPHEVYEMKEKKAEIINRDACMECGACALNCIVEAIEVNSGVGCATAVILGAINSTEPTCGCASTDCC